MPHDVTFESLYREHFGYVWQTLRRLGSTADEVADATQDVFLIAYRKLPDFEQRSTLRNWLFGICYRHLLQRRRKAKRESRVARDPEDLPGSDPDQQTLVEHRQQQTILAEILDHLTVEQRAVFTLHEIEGLEGEAIAELLAVPRGTVYSRLRTGREAFWKVVQQRRAREEFERQARDAARPPRDPRQHGIPGADTPAVLSRLGVSR